MGVGNLLLVFHFSHPLSVVGLCGMWESRFAFQQYVIPTGRLYSAAASSFAFRDLGTVSELSSGTCRG